MTNHQRGHIKVTSYQMGSICYDPSDAYDDKSFGIFIVVGRESQNKVIP